MIGNRTEWALLATPMVAFLVLLLGLPILLNLLYSVSEVSFETLRSPQVTGFGNYAEALSDPAFWRATWFSTRSVDAGRRLTQRRRWGGGGSALTSHTWPST